MQAQQNTQDVLVAVVLMRCRQIILAFAEWLCEYSRTNDDAVKIIKNMHLYLMPSSNPDGFHHKNRTNQ